ncbi:MAG: sterol desaturase family protein [bacterium]
MISKKVEDFRKKFRQEHLSPRYSGPLHLSLLIIMSLLIIVCALAMLDNVSAWELLTIPATFLYANLVEYIGHKGPMHKKTRLLAMIYQRHTVEHHQFFTEQATTCESTHDYKAILFSPLMLIFFFGLFAVPVGLLLYFLVSPNVAFLFVASAMAYYLNYDLLHLCYHLSEDSWVGRLPFMGVLRNHHTVHHNQKLMNKYNFNITYPIFDHLFGTVFEEKKHES